MGDIDWSKAPEWAECVIKSQDCGDDLYWCEKWGSDNVRRCIFGMEDRPIRAWNLANTAGRHAWNLIEIRPVTWSGEGLPPVGTVCEMIGCIGDPETTDYEKYKEHVGKNVTIIARHDVGSLAAVYACSVGNGEFEYYSMVSGCFAPIRTPEQVDAELREKSINVMRDIILDTVKYASGEDAKNYAEVLFEAGYRKFEITDDSESA